MRTAAIAFGCLVLAIASPVDAGVFSDDLSKCLVRSTTAADRAELVRWVFALISANPAIATMTPITQAQRDAATASTSKIIERLVIDVCHKESVAAIKYEGAGALKTSFEVLGQVAMQGLISDPAVAAQMQGLEKMADRARWAALAKEAGVVPPMPPSK